MKNKLIISLLLFVLISCDSKDITIQDGYTLKGNLKSLTENVSNVSVLLDGATVYQTTTDSEGNFEIKKIEKGMYSLSYKQTQSDSSFTSNYMNVKITNDTTLINLELPRPVLIYSSKNITSSTVEISWSQCNSQGFYEYKIFRKEDTGLDETTGKLVHISTEANDTTFTDSDLKESTKYYYRVYVMNNYGKLGGSKISSCETLKGNYVTNGSFEEFDTNQIATNWVYNSYYLPFDIKNYAKITNDSTAPDGKYSLLIDIPVYHYALSFGDLYQLINGKYLQQDIKYELSAWVKIIDLADNASCFIECVNGEYNQAQQIIIKSSETKNVWKRYSTEFYGSSSNSHITNTKHVYDTL